MKKSIAITLGAVALFAAGCSSSSGEAVPAAAPEAAATTTQAAAPKSAGLTSDEKFFVQAMDRANVAYIQPKAIVGVGEDACKALEIPGADGAAVVSSIVRVSEGMYSTEQAIQIVAAATVNLCPEHKDAFK